MSTATAQIQSIPERFRLLFNELGVNANEVALALGENNAKFYNILNGKAQPSFATIQQLIEYYPRINANYLLKGQKPILHTSGAQIEDVARQVSLPVYEAGNRYTEPHESYKLRLISEEETDYSTSVVVRLTDNSMLPRYSAGTRLLARPVPASEWEYLHSKLVMVLYRNTLVVRRIKENELISKDYLTLYADSPDGGFVHVRQEDVKSIWEIFDIVGRGNDL